MKTLKRLFLIKDLPVYIEAGDETEAIMLFETVMETVQQEGYDSLQEAIGANQSRVKHAAIDTQNVN
jgi:PII-like signaling protein